MTKLQRLINEKINAVPLEVRAHKKEVRERIKAAKRKYWRDNLSLEVLPKGDLRDTLLPSRAKPVDNKAPRSD